MSKEKDKLPEKIFVWEDTERDGSKYLMAYKSIDDCAEVGVKRFIGEYQLVKTGIVSAEVKLISTL